MPQEQNVLKCFSCETFQVHIVKKAKKWECKICGTKQSFKRTYGQGSGKDCRLHVMKLNELRVKKDCNVADLNFNQSFDRKEMNNVNDVNEKVNSIKENPNKNKWLQYIDDDEFEDEDLNCEEIDFKKNNKKRKRADDKQLTFENHFKRICDKKEINDNHQLPHDIFTNSESYIKMRRGSTDSKDVEEYKKIEKSEFKDAVKLEIKKDLLDCNKKAQIYLIQILMI